MSEKGARKGEKGSTLLETANAAHLCADVRGEVSVQRESMGVASPAAAAKARGQRGIIIRPFFAFASDRASPDSCSGRANATLVGTWSHMERQAQRPAFLIRSGAT